VGHIYEVGTQIGSYLLAAQYAEPVPEETPAVVAPLRNRIQFRVPPSPESHEEPIRPPDWFTKSTHQRTEAAERQPSKRKKRR
jgi:hypothetical protein